MTRLRILLVLCAALLALGLTPALAQEDMTGEDAPAVVLETESEPPEEEAWTFRFLVPTLLVATAVAVPLVIVAYGVRVRSRYRVTQ